MLTMSNGLMHKHLQDRVQARNSYTCACTAAPWMSARCMRGQARNSCAQACLCGGLMADACTDLCLRKAAPGTYETDECRSVLRCARKRGANGKGQMLWQEQNCCPECGKANVQLDLIRLCPWRSQLCTCKSAWPSVEAMPGVSARVCELPVACEGEKASVMRSSASGAASLGCCTPRCQEPSWL